MSITDPIADFFTRIRNSYIALHEDLVVPHSNLKVNILKILVKEGFIDSYKEINKNPLKKKIKINLKYRSNGECVISEIKRVSRSGRRLYVRKKDVPKVINGYGVSLLSTSKGVLSGREARINNVGGELIGIVY